MVLVDTSVWSLALRRDAPSDSTEVRALVHALEGGEPILTTGLVLQELLQGKHLPLPCYTVTAVHGEAHDQRFEVECLIAPPLNIRCSGTGTSRRRAEQEAARHAYQQAMHMGPA